MSKKAESRETHWERIAPQTAAPNIDDWYNTYSGRSVLRAFDELLPCSLESKNLLDVGCGVGYYFQYFRGRGVKECVGVDVGEKLLEIQRKVNPFVKNVLGSAESLPFPDECFDIVISLGLVEHFRNPQLVLHEFTRVLKRGGVLIIETPNKLNLIFTIYKILNRRKLVWEHWRGPKDLIREMQGIPNLKFERFTSSIVFAWYFTILVNNRISRSLGFRNVLSKVEHKWVFRNFGCLMFVASVKVDSKEEKGTLYEMGK